MSSKKQEETKQVIDNEATRIKILKQLELHGLIIIDSDETNISLTKNFNRIFYGEILKEYIYYRQLFKQLEKIGYITKQEDVNKSDVKSFVEDYAIHTITCAEILKRLEKHGIIYGLEFIGEDDVNFLANKDTSKLNEVLDKYIYYNNMYHMVMNYFMKK